MPTTSSALSTAPRKPTTGVASRPVGGVASSGASAALAGGLLSLPRVSLPAVLARCTALFRFGADAPSWLAEAAMGFSVSDELRLSAADARPLRPCIGFCPSTENRLW